MPRKKTSTNKKSHVQKQKIAARLLEISFKADDYIYKKKSISVEHAKKYLEEVEKFEPKCQGDVRSLQVIDKLTNLMKTIIEQGQTSQSCVSESSYNPFNITSTNASSNLDSTLKSTRSIQVQTNKSFEIRNIVADLENTNKSFEIQNIVSNLENTHDFDKANVTESERAQAVEFDLERTLSNLSLSIIDPGNKETFENIQFTNVEDSDIQTAGNAILIENGIREIGTISDQASKDQINCTNSSQMINLTPPSIITIDLDDSDNEIQNSVGAKPSNMTILEEYDDVIAKHTIEKPKKRDKQHDKKDPKEKKGGPNKQQKDGNKPKKNTNTKPKRARRNSKVNAIFIEDIIENKNRRQRKTKEIDLSWVENLKFVRIVEQTDYESFDLQDSFWENTHLPYDFSQYF